MSSTIVWLLVSLTTGSPPVGPHEFATQSACVAASATYMRLSRTNEQFRCEKLDGVVSHDRSPPH